MQLQENTLAPDFTLQNQDGIEVSLKDFLGKTLVLYFYPKDNTSGCTLEAQDFTTLFEEFQKCGAMIVGISPDSTQSHQKFIAKHTLKPMLLSDPQRIVSAKYGAFGEKKLYGKITQGIIRSTFIINPQGLILKAFYNVKSKGHAQKVLEALHLLK